MPLKPSTLIFHEIDRSQLTIPGNSIILHPMSNADLDQLRAAYKKAVDEWVAKIRAEEALAIPDHSMSAMEKLNDAHLVEHDAHENASGARDAYKDGLRRVNYRI